jgi:cyclic di-GMP phosphodiesterase
MDSLNTPQDHAKSPNEDKVLLVDDNPTNLQVLSQALAGQGLTLLIAKCGEDALKIAQDAQPRLILLDVNMPGIGGFETCKRLKSNPSTSDSVVVFLSARAEAEDKVQGLELGAVDYIAKPFNVDEVLARVRTQLENHRKHQSLIEHNRELSERATAPDRGSDDDPIRTLIRAGESDRLEFKSSLRWNMKAERAGKEIENAWLKTIVAFLNTDGGILLVGVDDDGEVLGIEHDGFENGDRYLLHANNLIRTTIGVEMTSFIDFRLKQFDNKQVFIVECKPSQLPVFLRRDGNEEFYIRMGPGSRKLLSSETLEYVQVRQSATTKATHSPTTSIPTSTPTDSPVPAPVPAPATVDSETPTSHPKILLVDDNTDNLKVLADTLGNGSYELLIARSGQEAIDIAREAHPSLILLDIMMPPGIDGYETCRILKSDDSTRSIPVILLSALNEIQDKVRGFNEGAVDYITKPFNAEEIVARVDTHLKLESLSSALARSNSKLIEINKDLERRVQLRSAELVQSRDAVIFGLAKLAESRDGDTGDHLERVCSYVNILATELAKTDPTLDEQWVNTITTTAALHDIGKVGIPDSVLLKPDKLTSQEYEIMKRHTTIGGDTLMALKNHWGDDSFLITAMEIAFAHHENWDGSGYPFGLAGASIPLAGRLTAIADVYDALRSQRVYKSTRSHEEARDMIVEGNRTQFDPALIEVFLRVESKFRDVVIDPDASGTETTP